MHKCILFYFPFPHRKLAQFQVDLPERIKDNVVIWNSAKLISDFPSKADTDCEFAHMGICQNEIFFLQDIKAHLPGKTKKKQNESEIKSLKSRSKFLKEITQTEGGADTNYGYEKFMVQNFQLKIWINHYLWEWKWTTENVRELL